jgi:hypothetical protein
MVDEQTQNPAMPFFAKLGVEKFQSRPQEEGTAELLNHIKYPLTHLSASLGKALKQTKKKRAKPTFAILSSSVKGAGQRENGHLLANFRLSARQNRQNTRTICENRPWRKKKERLES